MSGWRERGITGLLVVVLLVAAGVTAYQAVEVWVRLRVDTSVSAVARGEPGCVTSATFTDPTGRRHVVDLRVYKGNCVEGDPGDRVTVWYDASDPSVTSRSRGWWWPALLMVPGLVVGVLAARTLSRRLRGLPEPASARPVGGAARPRRVSQVAGPAAAGPDEAVGIMHREQDAHLVHDYALGRLEVLLDELDAERALPVGERSSLAGDELLAAARRGLADTAELLRAGAVDRAEQRYRGVMRQVSDGWDHRSDLGGRLLGFGRNLFG